jgi:hypothetical protein
MSWHDRGSNKKRPSFNFEECLKRQSCDQLFRSIETRFTWVERFILCFPATGHSKTQESSRRYHGIPRAQIGTRHRTRRRVRDAIHSKLRISLPSSPFRLADRPRSGLIRLSRPPLTRAGSKSTLSPFVNNSFSPSLPNASVIYPHSPPDS